jgi:hypothetical protein
MAVPDQTLLMEPDIKTDTKTDTKPTSTSDDST